MRGKKESLEVKVKRLEATIKVNNYIYMQELNVLLSMIIDCEKALGIGE